MSEIQNHDALDKEGVFLGALQVSNGRQKYLIPCGIDLSKYNSIDIHCREFLVVWGGVNLR